MWGKRRYRDVHIRWDDAMRLLASGVVVHAGQTHGGLVTLVDAKGRRYSTQGPAIDAILGAIRELPAEVRARITVATE